VLLWRSDGREKSFRLTLDSLSWPEYRHCQSDACREGTCAPSSTRCGRSTGSLYRLAVQHDAIQAINTILARDRLPFLCRRLSTLYPDGHDHFDIPHIPPQPELRAQLESRPLADLLTQLEELDPQSAASIDQKILGVWSGALEVCIASGKPFRNNERL